MVAASVAAPRPISTVQDHGPVILAFVPPNIPEDEIEVAKPRIAKLVLGRLFCRNRLKTSSASASLDTDSGVDETD